MDESRVTLWGAATIAGICAIVGAIGGAMVQQHRESVSPEQDSGKLAALKSQLEERDAKIGELNGRLSSQAQAVEGLQAQLQACQASVAQLKAQGDKPCPTPGTAEVTGVASPSGPSSQTQIEGGLSVKLERCVATGSEIECEFQVTALREDLRITPLVGRDGSRLVDQDGNEVQASEFKMGSTPAQMPEVRLVQDIPVRATIFFERVPSSSNTLRLLQVTFALRRHPFSVNFKGITVQR
ncbi:MAG TPA: hypothetical protein VGP73_18480 [Thermoanaerobaculia bacterium]